LRDRGAGQLFHFFAEPKSDKAGFTLIELLVVIAIIGTLSGMVLVAMTDTRAKARDARRNSDITQIRKALELYYAEKGNYPLSGGALSPNGGWTNSNDSSWNTFATALVPYMNLPKDPINTASGWVRSNANTYTYTFYSLGYGCQQHWYMISYRLEKPNMVSPGTRSCPYTGYTDGYYFNYGSTDPSSAAFGVITVGMRQK